jgi:hypothetical protein
MIKMSSRYTEMKVHISNNLKSKIKQATEKGEPVTVKLLHEDLQGNDVLAFTKSQLSKIAEAFNNQKGITIRMSKTQVEHNKQIEGGFIFPVLGAIASAVLPSLASAAIDRIMGKGLFIKSGSGIVKVKQLGDGLYLRTYCTEGITEDGLFIKRGGNSEPVNDMSVTRYTHYSLRSLAYRPEANKFDYELFYDKCQYISLFTSTHNLPISLPVAVLWYPAEDVSCSRLPKAV